MDIPSVLMTFCPQNLENGRARLRSQPQCVAATPGRLNDFLRERCWWCLRLVSHAFLWIFELGTVVSQGDFTDFTKGVLWVKDGVHRLAAGGHHQSECLRLPGPRWGLALDPPMDVLYGLLFTIVDSQSNRCRPIECRHLSRSSHYMIHPSLRWDVALQDAEKHGCVVYDWRFFAVLIRVCLKIRYPKNKINHHHPYRNNTPKFHRLVIIPQMSHWTYLLVI